MVFPQKWIERALVLAGVGIWALKGALPLLSAWATLGTSARLGWVLAALAWLAAFLFAGVPKAGVPRACRSKWVYVILGVESVTTLVLCALSGSLEPSPLFVPVAGQLGFVVSVRTSVVWVIVQSLALLAVRFRHVATLAALVDMGGLLTFQVFALAVAYLAASEMRAREELSLAHAELQTTRALLVESSRQAERLRISRDLHDTLGHHLTALSLNLEVAGHLARDKTAKHVHRAHTLARLLLAEVRAVVGTLRHDRPIDLRQAIEVLARELPRPRIHLDLPPELRLQDAAAAHTVLSCVREVVSNAVRHAAAANLWIKVAHNPVGLHITARDDGRGAPAFTPGNGLTGMSERLKALGGHLTTAASPGRGFEVSVFLPLAEPAP